MKLQFLWTVSKSYKKNNNFTLVTYILESLVVSTQSVELLLLL